MTSKLRACTKRPASSAWPSLKDGPRATSTWFSAKHYEPERPMSVRGQTEKNSVRAYVFRFALELGHCSMQSALRILPKPEVFNGLGHVPLAQWMSAVRSRHRLPPPGRAMRAYQTSGHLPVAVAQAFVLTRPTRGVDTSAQAICDLILTSRRVWHCFCR